MVRDVVVIGSGPAGYSAAIYAARASLSPLLISGFEEGGQLMTTTDVENYPGFASAIQGPWLMDQMREQASHVGAEMLRDYVKSVDFSVRPFKILTENSEILAKTIIIATGAQAKWLGTVSEAQYRGFGVSGCATCDGFFYRGKNVIVVGGGNTAVEEALYLTKHASKVYLVHRRDALKSEKILQNRLFEHPKIEVIWDSEIHEFCGVEEPNRSLTHVILRNIKTDKKTDMKIDGVFIAIGHKPATDIFRNSALNLDSDGYIITQAGTTKTSIPGVFAAGDVQDRHYRQAITAAGTGCMAALDALHFIESGGNP